jgi:phosphoribosylglycinamide formyltransferase-1
MSHSPINLAVLISGGGTTLQNFIDRIADGSLHARTTTVISSRPGIGGITKAQAAGLGCHTIERKSSSSVSAFSQTIFDICRKSKADLICLAGWLSMLEIPKDFENRIMNIHPALLPSFGGKGMYGLRVHQAVLDAGCKVSGCTVHFVNQEYDNGPIILQRCCPVLENDTAPELAHRVFEQEKLAYPEAIRLFAAGRLHVEGPRVRIAGEGKASATGHS